MQTLFYNGSVLTMDSPVPLEALLLDGDTIQAVGTYAEISALALPNTRRADLQGHALLPAFIDAHSHFAAAANSFLQVSMDGATDFDEITRRLQRYIIENHLLPGEWVRAGGYDHNTLAEKRHPTAALLDQAAPQNPVILQHTSGHMGVFNTRALELLNVPSRENAVAGGRIRLEDGRPTGYMEENAFLQNQSRVPMPDANAFLHAFEKAQQWYLSHGITYVQEGMFSEKLIPLYQTLLVSGLLKLEVVGYPDFDSAPAVYSAFSGALQQGGTLRLGGYKMFLDGSPQGRTAWLRKPYLGTTECGYGTLDDDVVYRHVCQAASQGRQLLAHCNGDAACEQYIRAVEKAEDKGFDVKRIRPVMIHAQLLGRDQLTRVKKAGLLPSFFVAHVYHWGDVHLQNLGKNRAAAISPAASALREDIRFTFHQDTPVVAPDMLQTVWCAANRLSKTGRVLGENERISVYEALRAVTANAAYQYFEEDRRGTLRPGKKADLVILDRSPLSVFAGEVCSLRVLATIKNGTLLYSC